MRKTVGSIESGLSIEIHLKLTSSHLRNTVIDGLIGVKSSFEISIFE
jgi:hypothetical protein